MVAGRELTWTEIYGRRPVVIISENLARETWGSPSAALGKRLRELPKTPWFEVVGVVEDVRVNGVQEKAPAIVYWPSMVEGRLGPNTFDATRSATFAIRSDRAGTEAFLSEIQQAVWSVNPSLPLASVRTMQEIYSQSLARTSFTLVMLGIAAPWRWCWGSSASMGDFLCGVAAHAGNRNSAGAGRAKRPAPVDVRPLRIGADGIRPRHRSGGGSRVDAAYEITVVWGQPAGSCYLCIGTDGFGRVRGARQLSAGSACGGGESCGGFELVTRYWIKAEAAQIG